MGEAADLSSATAGAAIALLRRARVDLGHLERLGADHDVRRALVVGVADRLDTIARDAGCPLDLAVLLHDWRDRLGSHVLVAEALADLEVHPDLADQLLRRGLVEVLEEAPARLAARPAGTTRAAAGD
jgi:hypothetical protein